MKREGKDRRSIVAFRSAKVALFHKAKAALFRGAKDDTWPVLLPLLLLFTPLTMAQENVRLACEPRTVAVVPGEPVRVEFTVQSASAAPVRVHIPADPLLVLRAVEKLPVRRTTEGVIIHKRVVIWQALEPGAVALRAISVETQGRKRLFPEITITVSDPGP
jgi:hypothetical protein